MIALHLPLIVGSGSGDEGMAIFSGSSSKGKIGFADAATDDSGSYRGYFQYDHSGDNLNIGTAGSEVMRIDSSGSVGLGNTDPGGMHSMVNRLVVGSGSGNQGLAIYSGAGNEGAIGFARAIAANTDAYDGLIEYSQADRSMRFGTNAGAERMRLKTGLAIGTSTDPGSGSLSVNQNVYIGTTNTTVTSNTLGHYFDKDGYANHRRNSAPSLYLNRYGTEGNIQIFYHAGTGVGSISVSNDATAFNTSSDYRLKNVKGSIQNALERTLALNPVEFEWKESGKTSEGFIAHEAQEIFSDAVSGEKDGEEMQGMDYGRITPLLVKAIQELSAEVEQLKQQAHDKCEN